ncbi:hypothetical protein SNEBB_011162 [Seison nebaliae]|nr:hypothetical protein SNEBB_011162 [Seison nebaliae]
MSMYDESPGISLLDQGNGDNLKNNQPIKFNLINDEEEEEDEDYEERQKKLHAMLDGAFDDDLLSDDDDDEEEEDDDEMRQQENVTMKKEIDGNQKYNNCSNNNDQSTTNDEFEDTVNVKRLESLANKFRVQQNSQLNPSNIESNFNRHLPYLMKHQPIGTSTPCVDRSKTFLPQSTTDDYENDEGKEENESSSEASSSSSATSVTSELDQNDTEDEEDTNNNNDDDDNNDKMNNFNNDNDINTPPFNKKKLTEPLLNDNQLKVSSTNSSSNNNSLQNRTITGHDPNDWKSQYEHQKLLYAARGRKLDELNGELENLRDICQMEINKYKNINEEKDKVINELNDMCQNVQTTLSLEQEKFENVQKEKELMRDEQEQLNGELNELKKELEEKHLLHEITQKRLTSFMSEMATLKEQKQSTNDYVDANEMVESLRERIRLIDNERSELKLNNRDLRLELQQEKYTNQSASIEHLNVQAKSQESLRNTLQENEQLQQQIASLRLDNMNLKNNKNIFQHETDDISNRTKLGKDIVTTSTPRSSVKNRTMHHLQMEIDNLKQILQSHIDNENELTRMNKELQQKYQKDLDEEMKRKQTEFDEIMKELQSNELETVNGLQNELNEMKVQFEVELNEMKEEKLILESEVMDTKKRFIDLNDENKRIITSFETKRMEIEEETNRCQLKMLEKDQECRDVQMEKEELEENMENLKKIIEKLEKEKSLYLEEFEDKMKKKMNENKEMKNSSLMTMNNLLNEYFHIERLIDKDGDIEDPLKDFEKRLECLKKKIGNDFLNEKYKFEKLLNEKESSWNSRETDHLNEIENLKEELNILNDMKQTMNIEISSNVTNIEHLKTTIKNLEFERTKIDPSPILIVGQVNRLIGSIQWNETTQQLQFEKNVIPLNEENIVKIMSHLQLKISSINENFRRFLMEIRKNNEMVMEMKLKKNDEELSAIKLAMKKSGDELKEKDKKLKEIEKDSERNFFNLNSALTREGKLKGKLDKMELENRNIPSQISQFENDLHNLLKRLHSNNDCLPIHNSMQPLSGSIISGTSGGRSMVKTSSPQTNKGTISRMSQWSESNKINQYFQMIFDYCSSYSYNTQATNDQQNQSCQTDGIIRIDSWTQSMDDNVVIDLRKRLRNMQKEYVDKEKLHLNEVKNLKRRCRRFEEDRSVASSNSSLNRERMSRESSIQSEISNSTNQSDSLFSRNKEKMKRMNSSELRVNYDYYNFYNCPNKTTVDENQEKNQDEDNDEDDDVPDTPMMQDRHLMNNQIERIGYDSCSPTAKKFYVDTHYKYLKGLVAYQTTQQKDQMNQICELTKELKKIKLMYEDLQRKFDGKHRTLSSSTLLSSNNNNNNNNYNISSSSLNPNHLTLNSSTSTEYISPSKHLIQLLADKPLNSKEDRQILELATNVDNEENRLLQRYYELYDTIADNELQITKLKLENDNLISLFQTKEQFMNEQLQQAEEMLSETTRKYETKIKTMQLQSVDDNLGIQESRRKELITIHRKQINQIHEIYTKAFIDYAKKAATNKSLQEKRLSNNRFDFEEFIQYTKQYFDNYSITSNETPLVKELISKEKEHFHTLNKIKAEVLAHVQETSARAAGLVRRLTEEGKVQLLKMTLDIVRKNLTNTFLKFNISSSILEKILGELEINLEKRLSIIMSKKNSGTSSLGRHHRRSFSKDSDTIPTKLTFDDDNSENGNNLTKSMNFFTLQRTRNDSTDRYVKFSGKKEVFNEFQQLRKDTNEFVDEHLSKYSDESLQLINSVDLLSKQRNESSSLGRKNSLKSTHNNNYDCLKSSPTTKKSKDYHQHHHQNNKNEYYSHNIDKNVDNTHRLGRSKNRIYNWIDLRGNDEKSTDDNTQDNQSKNHHNHHQQKRNRSESAHKHDHLNVQVTTNANYSARRANDNSNYRPLDSYLEIREKQRNLSRERQKSNNNSSTKDRLLKDSRIDLSKDPRPITIRQENLIETPIDKKKMSMKNSLPTSSLKINQHNIVRGSNYLRHFPLPLPNSSRQLIQCSNLSEENLSRNATPMTNRTNRTSALRAKYIKQTFK